MKKIHALHRKWRYFMSLVKYSVFKTVVETGSFTQAADKLDMTQSAVSHAMASLEQEIGFHLFERSKKGILITNEGRKILQYVESLMSAEDRLKNQINSINNIEEGILRIGSFSSASSRLLPPIIAEYEKRHPKIKLVFREGGYKDISDWLVSGKVDVGFLVQDYIDKTLFAVHYMTDEMYALLPTKFNLGEQEEFDMDTLGDYPYIMAGSSNKRYLDNMFRGFNVKPNVKYKVMNLSTVFAMIEKGLGMCIVPESTLLRSTYNFDILPLKGTLKRDVYITVKKRHQSSPVVQAFFDVAKDVRLEKYQDSIITSGI